MFLQQDLLGGTLNILPILSFVLGIAITIIQLYIASSMAKQEEKILKILRDEREVAFHKMDLRIKELEYEIHQRIDRNRAAMLTKEEHAFKEKISEHQIFDKVSDRVSTLINQAKNELRTDLKTFIRNNNKP